MMDKVLIFIGMMMNKEEAERLSKRITEHLGDDCFVMIYRRQDPKIEVFYSKDVTHISLDELTEKIKKSFQPLDQVRLTPEELQTIHNQGKP